MGKKRKLGRVGFVKLKKEKGKKYFTRRNWRSYRYGRMRDRPWKVIPLRNAIIAAKYFIAGSSTWNESTLRETDHRVVNYRNPAICFSDDRNWPEPSTGRAYSLYETWLHWKGGVHWFGPGYQAGIHTTIGDLARSRSGYPTDRVVVDNICVSVVDRLLYSRYTHVMYEELSV